MGNHGDGNFDLYALLLVGLPLVSYATLGVRRHLSHLHIAGTFPMWSLLFHWDDYSEETRSDGIMEVANTFGMMAVVALGIFLVPASKHGPILRVFGWSHAMAIRLHIWAARILVVGALLHGLLHTFRWKYQLEEDVVAFLLPPSQCWTRNSRFAPTCHNEDTECTCYMHFVYFTGTVAGTFAMIILITSSNSVRRASYRLFLTSHILVAPLFLLTVMFHYHRAVLYMSPSILYYLATTLVPYLEQRRQCQNGGVAIQGVDFIGDSTMTDEQYIALTVEATPDTVQAFRPGMYTYLRVPQISTTARHPFTVNTVVNQPDALRIIFKVTGPFTRALASILRQATSDVNDDEDTNDPIHPSKLPVIQLSGLYGCPTRMHQVRHHTNNIWVAGGIGVTPFLSLLWDVVESNAHDVKEAWLPQYASRLQTLSLHWACRSWSLLQYIQAEYIDKPQLTQKHTPYCQTRIYLYHTGDSSLKLHEHDEKGPGTFVSNARIRRYAVASDEASPMIREPFRLSRLAPGRRIRDNLLTCLTMSILLWPGLAIVWLSYKVFQHGEEMMGRGVAPLVLLVYMASISWLVSRFVPYHWFGKGWSKADVEFKLLNDDSEHSYEERLTLSQDSSMVELSETSLQQEQDENPHRVRVTIHSEGRRPDLATILEQETLEGKHPAVFSSGPSHMSNHVRAILEEVSTARSQVQPTCQAPLVTLYDEAFLL